MRDLHFEHAFRFHKIQDNSGRTVWFPLVTVTLLRADGSRVQLPLLFDTGASTTTLRHDLYHLLDVPSWDSGEPRDVAVVGPAKAQAYRYQARLEFLGKVVDCPVHLQQLTPHPLYQGLFGREGVFDSFGFGFWENAHELYITLQP